MNARPKEHSEKEKRKPLVGDNVEIDILDEEEKTGNITEIHRRKNELIRPAVANIDQALVVFAVTKPKPHLNLLDRFLVMMECKEIPVVLCFNKKICQKTESGKSCSQSMRHAAIRRSFQARQKKKISIWYGRLCTERRQCWQDRRE